MELQYVKVHQYDTPKTCQYNDGCSTKNLNGPVIIVQEGRKKDA